MLFGSSSWCRGLVCGVFMLFPEHTHLLFQVVVGVLLPIDVIMADVSPMYAHFKNVVTFQAV